MAGQQGVGGLEVRLREAVSQRLGSGRYGLWFGEGVSLGLQGDAIEVGVPNAFFREWIQGHFAGNLLEAGESVAGRPLRLTFRVDDEATPQVGHVIEPAEPDGRPQHVVKVPFTPGAPAQPNVSPPLPLPPSDRPRLASRVRRQDPGETLPPPPRSATAARPSRRLDDFVTGPCNRLAHAATVEMTQSLGASFNPLVIHAGVGLGKTHLLEGAGTALRARRPGMRLIHVTAESFTNGFLDAMRAGALGSFRSRFRGAEALVVDDIHFLAAKRATQDEFLHTFNALMSDGVPIIVAVDQHPRLITKLTDELATRFLGGMVVKLDAPDPATRRAILKAKALMRGVDVPDSVIAYIAEHLRASVRELEGALHSLIAHAMLTGKRLDLNLAKAALRDTIRHTSQSVALRDVERTVCQLFLIEPEALKSESRTRALTYPRMLAMYLARKHTGAAYSEIGRFFGGRNHSTVISAEKKVVGWIKDEQQRPPLAGFETIADVLASLERSLGA
ncbi:MAG: chromosomal replication initiator protein DnaA [Isosphaeraceae bacterium]